MVDEHDGRLEELETYETGILTLCLNVSSLRELETCAQESRGKKMHEKIKDNAMTLANMVRQDSVHPGFALENGDSSSRFSLIFHPRVFSLLYMWMDAYIWV